MKGFNLKTIIEQKTPKTRITRKHPLKILPEKKFLDRENFSCEKIVSRYAIKKLFSPWYSPSSMTI